MIEVRVKVEFSELSQKAFTKMKQFWKLRSMENSVLLKDLKGLTLRAPKSLVSKDAFCIIYIGQRFAFGRWVDGAE